MAPVILCLLVASLALWQPKQWAGPSGALQAQAQASGGIIKSVFSKVTGSGDSAKKLVPESAPVCGASIFGSNPADVSPEMVFISPRLTREIGAPGQSEVGLSKRNQSRYPKEKNKEANQSPSDDLQYGSERNRRPATSRPRTQEAQARSAVAETVLNEFRFHVDNVSMAELRAEGFNPRAPTTFLIHGFTSGYPLQAWMSAIVDIYSINERQYQEERKERPTGAEASQNLFVVNWHYGARTINYARAVANVPVVAGYLVKFIDRLVDELGVDTRHYQLVGHSLGSHVAGFTGKNTKTRLGRIYGLDPAGPCFGKLPGYPASQRLEPSDADEVITLVTNSELLGLDEQLGHYSVFVEGGKSQPGCKPGAIPGILKTLEAFALDGGDLGGVACSHSRAPLLMAYRHHQGAPALTSANDDGHDLRDDDDDDNDQQECQMVAYECADWDSFKKGHCGHCDRNNNQCLLVGLNWQYPNQTNGYQSASGSSALERLEERGLLSSILRPSSSTHASAAILSDSGHRENQHQRETSSSHSENGYPATQSAGTGNEPTVAGASKKPDGRRKMFLRTGDTQPYCTYQYQLSMELHEPFDKKFKPQLSIVFQDDRASERRSHSDRPAGAVRTDKNSLSTEEFGFEVNHLLYTQLITSSYKIRRPTRATMLSVDGIEVAKIKQLRVNYMSNIDYRKRQKYSATLCVVKTTNDKPNEHQGLNPVVHNTAQDQAAKQNRIYFGDCNYDDPPTTSQSPHVHTHTHTHTKNQNQNHDYQSGHQNQRRPVTSTQRPDYDPPHYDDQIGRRTTQQPDTFSGYGHQGAGRRTTTRRPYPYGDQPEDTSDYSASESGSGYSQGGRRTTRRPASHNDPPDEQSSSGFSSSGSSLSGGASTTRRPHSGYAAGSGDSDGYEGTGHVGTGGRTTTRRPPYSQSSSGTGESGAGSLPHSDHKQSALGRRTTTTEIPYIDEDSDERHPYLASSSSSSSLSSSSGQRKQHGSGSGSRHKQADHGSGNREEEAPDTRIVSDAASN